MATAAEEARKERRVRLSDEIFTPPSYARRCVVVEGLSSRGGLVGVVLGDGVGGVDPGGVDHVAELDGSGGEALFGEGLAVGGSGAGEAAGLFELVGLLDESVGVVEVVEVVGPLVGDEGGLGGGDEGGDVGGLDVGGDVDGLEEGVDFVVGGVAGGVGAGPAVVLDGGVQGHGAVGDVVREPAGVEEDGGLDGGCVFVGGGKFAVLAEVRLEALPDFFYLPGLHADFFRGEGDVGVRGLCGSEGADEVVALAGEHFAVGSAACGGGGAGNFGELGPL